MSELICVFLLATMSLHDAVTQAVAHSPDVRVLEAQVAEARANAVLADAFRPGLSVSTTPGYATGLPTAVLGQVPAIGTIEAHRLLYDTSAHAERIGAMSQIDAAVARLESRKREIAQNTAELYARVAADTQLIDSAQRRVDAYQTIASRTGALRKEGRVRDLDVDRADLQVASAKRAVVQAQSHLDLDQFRLRQLVGDTVAAGLTPPAGDETVKASAPIDVVQANDPELRSLEARIVALQRISASQRHFFQPTVAAQVQYSRLFDRYGRYYLNFKPDDFIVGATVTLPVLTGGRRSATVARMDAQLQELTAMRDARRAELESALREAQTDLEQALAERDLASRARAVAAEGLRVAEDLAREGRGEANDVPLATIALADADDDVANAAAHVAIAESKLKIVRGDPI